MTDPIDLNARRDERVPEPEGEPAITMPMDSDQIIFRDQAALDDYVAGATVALRAELDNLRETLAQKIEAAVLPIDHTKTVTVVDVQRQCAAIVRGSDDEAQNTSTATAMTATRNAQLPRSNDD